MMNVRMGASNFDKKIEKAKRKKIASFKLRKKQSTENDDVKATMFFFLQHPSAHQT